MNKLYAVLPMLMLSACYMNASNEVSDRPSLFGDDPVELSEDLVVSDAEVAPAATAEVAPIAAPAVQPATPVMPSPNKPQLSADGTTIELPAQQIYIGAAVPPPMPQQPNPYGTRVISYSAPAAVQQPVMAMPVYQPEFITLQYTAYPNTFVQCPVGDYQCVSSYEQQGFVQIQNKPRFAGYQDVTLTTDYPEGKWRYGNNIPRW